MTVGSVKSGAAAPPVAGRRALASIVWLGLVALILGAGAVLPPIRETSATSLSPEVRHETVAAALERGLAPLHPLILDASVEPGLASSAPELGHRATVTFSMLGVPGPTRVKLFVDVGAHWGGTPDRLAAELAFWSLLTPLLVLGSPWLVWRVRRRRADQSSDLRREQDLGRLSSVEQPVGLGRLGERETVGDDRCRIQVTRAEERQKAVPVVERIAPGDPQRHFAFEHQRVIEREVGFEVRTNHRDRTAPTDVGERGG